MKNSLVAKRYAEVFLEHAKASLLGLDKAVEELRHLKLLLGDNPEFEKLLDNADISRDEKIRIIEAVLKDFSQDTRDFMKLLLAAGRAGYINEICDYARINYAHGEVKDILLKTTFLLDAEMIRKIKAKLEHKFKKKFDLHIELDGGLLGGIQVTVGNILIDGSVKKRLSDLRNKLMKVRVN